MGRVNFSPGRYGDLSQPLIEIDPDAPRSTHVGQREVGELRWTVPASLVIGPVGAALYLPTWGLAGYLVYVGLFLAVAGTCLEPRRGEAWQAEAREPEGVRVAT